MMDQKKTSLFPNYDVGKVLNVIFDSKNSHWKPSEKIPLVLKEIEKLKNDMQVYLKDIGQDIICVLNESKELYDESHSLLSEMEHCKREIEEETMAQILKSIENHDLLVKELQCVNFAINIVYDVVQCSKHVKEFTESKDSHSFTRAIEAVNDIKEYVDTPAEGFEELDLYANVKCTSKLFLDALHQDLNDEWKKIVFWSTLPDTQKTVITITLNLNESFTVFDVLNAMDKSKMLSEKVYEFGQFLLKEVMTPIIHHECTVFAETDELMSITIYHRPNFRPDYDAVIFNNRLLLHYLSNKFNIEYSNEKSLMKILGKQISVEFCDMLVKDCLVDTVPNNINELQCYGKITSEIVDFQHFLEIVKFLPPNTYSILDYVKNIDVLFANKSSQYYLETARTIMLKDLSQTMSIGVETIPDAKAGNSPPALEETEEEALDVLDKTISNSLFYFPRCMISKTTQEILDLVYIMMEQAVQCPDIVCKKLYNTTRLVFELYDAVVPYYHENYLQTIPQYVALFHNNCMYLAHNLQTFGDKWLVLMEGRKLDYPIGFVDLVQKMRNLGYKQLTVHMQQQRKQILDNIRSSDLNCLAMKDVLGDNAEAAVRQCLRQMQILKNVWIGVFPSNVFKRLMTALVNMFLEELIHRVCTVEDISMEMATQLSDIYTVVVKKIPQMFQNPQDIEGHVKSWIRLQKLIFVLGASLKDIETNWQDGKGPLAINFSTNELRTLIKALFQNTQFRANLLTKIK